MATDLPELVSVNPAVCHGQACVRGTRVLVSVVLDCLAGGMREEEILVQYPTLTPQGVRATLAYGALLAREELLVLDPAEWW